jgi:acetyl esterase/lipase
MVSIAAQYRLSNQKDVTPLEAMMDARDIIRWLRRNCDSLKIDPNKIVAFGWSAGAHLAASAAVFPDTTSNENSIPNALVLVSPAVSITTDNWARKILLGRTDINTISPDEHVRRGLPPTIILQGRDDTVTPLSGVKLFADAMLRAGNKCELIIYDGVGHLFTPSSLPDYDQPQPDKKIKADAYKAIDTFLLKNGYCE